MKRMTALLLSVIMMIGMLPVSAVAAGGPSNITWHEGSYLLVTWEDDGAPIDTTYDIVVYHSDSADGPWRQVDYESNWEKDTAYAIQCVQWTGPGYYKVEIRRSGSDEWTESEPYLLILNGTAKHGRIAAPVSGSFDAAGGELSWTDPAEGVDYNYNYSNYRHTAVVRMWYTGENGELDKSQWELHDIYFAWEDTCTLNNFSKSGLKSGQYAFSVNNFAEDYCWRGQSTTLILDGRYTYEVPAAPDTPVLDGPINVMWTEDGGVSWTLPEVPVDVEFQLLRSAILPVNDESFTVIWNFDYAYSGSMEEAYALQMELSEIAKVHRMEHGAGFYAFRVRYTSAEGNSDWVWSDFWNNGSSDLAQDAGDLQWNVVHQANGSKSMPGYIAFRAPENYLYEVDIRLRTATGSTSVASWSGRVWDKDFENIDFTGNIAHWQNGTYYFTVQLRNDNGTAGNLVTSPDWVYTAPDKVLQATNLTWNTDELKLDWETEEELVQWASVEVYYNGTSNNSAAATLVNYAYANEDMTSAELSKTLFNNGAGWYWFKVRLGSNNILQAQNSKDEAFSPVFYFADNADKLQVTNPRWTGDGLGMTWDIPAGQADAVDAYNVVFYYNTTNEAPDPDTSFWVDQANFGPNDNWKMPDYVLENANRGDGYYFFTVTPMTKHPLLARDGDRSSISGGLRYNAPELKLNTYNTGWNENNEMIWEVEENFDSSLVDRYEVRFYYGKTENSVDTVWPVYYETYYSIKNSYAPPAEMLEQCGEGWYAFEICAYSNDLFAAQTGEWSGVGEAAYLEKVTQPMPAPYDLQWGVVRWEDDSENFPGMISFAGTVPEDMEEVSYRVEVYRREASGDVRVARQWGYLDRYSGMYSNVNPFAGFAGYIASGTYYFTVTAVGDDLRYADSATVTSPDWVYTRPATQLTISNPVWNSDMTMSWQNGTAQADYYEIRFQYVGAGETLNPYDWHSTISWHGNGSPTIDTWMLEQYGPGTYHFQVRAMSNDITKVLHSDWTDWSAPFECTAPELVLKAEKLKWNEETYAMEWQLAAGDESMVGRYEIQVWWNDEPSDVGVKIGNFGYDADDAPYTLPQWVWNEYGPGYYFFRVRIDSNNPMLALSGQWSNFVKTPLHFAGPDQQAPQATELQWHVERYDAYNSTAKLGVINFKNPCYDDGNTRTEFKITVFEQLANGNRVVGTLNTRSRNLYVNAYPFDYFPEEMITGTYYFAVTTVGDKITTSNSEPVVSGTWNYTRPAVQKTISAPVWNDNLSMNWTDGTNPGDFYQIRIQWVSEGGTFYEDNWQSSMTIYDKAEATLPEWLFTDYGPGTFYFKVRAMSEDITKAVSSDWTEWSAPFKYTEPNKGLITISPDWADGMQMTWTTPANLLPYVKAYEVYFYHSESPDAEFEQDDWWDWERYMPGQSSYAVPEWVINNLGEGYYWFRVVALTNDPTQAMGGLWSDMSPAYHLGADGSTLAPTDLQWDTKTGVLSFSNPYFDNHKTDSQFRVEVYRKDAAGDVLVGSSNSGTNGEYVNFAPFENNVDNLQTGEYYFTVYTKAGNGHGQSEKVTSGTWSYTRPNAQLTVSAPVWNDDMTMSWTNGTMLGERYKIRYQFVPAGGTLYPNDYHGSLTTDESGNVVLPERWLEKNGAGTYYFRVMALSNDLTEVVHSKWSDWSAGYEYTGETQQPEAAVTAPSAVYWHKTTAWATDAAGKNQQILVDLPGSIAWKRAQNADGTFADHGEYRLEIWNAETGDRVVNSGIGIGSSSKNPYVECPNFIYNDMPSGKYYFRVCALDADDNQTEWVVSDTWEYTKPIPKLGVTGGIGWSNDSGADGAWAMWYGVEGAGGYQVHFFFAKDENAELQSVNISHVYDPSTIKELRDKYLTQYGEGLWYYKVKAIPGDITEYAAGDWSDLSPALDTRTNVGPELPKLSAPTEVYWHKEATWGVTGDSQMVEILIDRTGAIAWKRAQNADGTFADHGEYELEIYDAVTGQCVNDGNIGIGRNSTNQYADSPNFIYRDLPSGTYYFRVRAVSLDDQHAASDWVTSGTWTYTQPNAMLDTPTNLHWNVSTDGNGDPVYVAEWDEVDNRGFFDVRFYYAADANSAPQYIGSSRDTRGNSVELPAGKLEKYGDGLYFFTVRAIPEEIEDYQRGNESEMSPALNTREPVKPVASVTVGGTTTNYTNLTSALIAAQNASGTVTLTLLADVEGSVTVGGGTFTLDLNGHSIIDTTSNGTALTVNGGTVTITDSGEDGTISGGSYGVFAENGSVTVTGGTISGGRTGVYVYTDGAAAITGGTISGDSHGVFVYTAGTAAISGGTMSGNHGVYLSGGSATVSGGILTGNTYGVFVNDGSLFMENGTVSGTAFGLYVETGTITIAGGTISGTSDNSRGVYISRGIVIISGGIVIGGDSGVYVSRGSLSVSGGSFSHAPASDYIAEGGAAVWNTATGLYDVVRAEPEQPAVPAPTDPKWKNSTTMTWDSDLENVDHYQIQIQYVPAGGTFNPENWLYSMHWYDGAPAYLEEDFFYNYGSGTYYFRVNACVNQDGSYVYTDYSDWSAGMSYTLPAPNVTAEAYGRYVYVDGYLPAIPNVKYRVVVYSAEGQMLDMLTLDGLSEQAEIDLDSDCPNGAYIRVFTTEGWTPVADVLEANVAIMR